MQNIEKLEKVIDGGNYYGAQQMYKSTSARFGFFFFVNFGFIKLIISNFSVWF